MLGISSRHRVRLALVYRAVLWLVACCGGGSGVAAPADGQDVTISKHGGGYNVLFLMTDEQHYRSLSSTGNRYITTPNMDRIGREGARFDHATCVTPYCSPSRASIITGVYPHTHRILMNVGDGKRGPAPLSQNAFPNTETILHRQGYATAHRGKWHLSATSDFAAGSTGDFDCYEPGNYLGKTDEEYKKFLDERLPANQFAGHPSPGKYLGRPVEMIPAMEKTYRAAQADPQGYWAYIAIIGRSVIPPELLPETRITDDALRLLEQHAHERFMITVSWSPPHDLWVAPEPYYSLIDRRKIEIRGSRTISDWCTAGFSKRLGDMAGEEGIREFEAVYYGMVKYIDDQVGRVLNKLDELGLAENTLVIFTTDHGDMVGAHGCIGKCTEGYSDDLVRIPLLMRLPGVIKAGTVVRQPVSQVDLMPTILDYVGQSLPEHIHGQSARPLLEGRDVPWRNYAFCQRADQSRMLRTERYKYVFAPRSKNIALYDLQQDPDENHDLAHAPELAGVVRQMHRHLLQVMAKDGDPLQSKFPDDPLP